MAIPDWTWGSDDGSPGVAGGAETLADVTANFEVLAEETRLEILTALADDDPRSYTDLQDATSVTDNGRFNYHLRQLQPTFVRNADDGYVLSEYGRVVVRTVLPD